MSGRVGLAIGRFQPLHKGHCRIINAMMQDCETVIVVIGSTQKSREEANPFNVDERMKMIKNVYGDRSRIKLVPISDIGQKPEDPLNMWIDYVFDKIKKVSLPEPTDLYTGRLEDAVLYRGRFWDGTFDEFCRKFKILGYTNFKDEKPVFEQKNFRPGLPFKKGDEADFITPDGVLRLMHVIGTDEDRGFKPGTAIRKFLSVGDNEWTKLVPPVNHNIVGGCFPDAFKSPHWTWGNQQDQYNHLGIQQFLKRMHDRVLSGSNEEESHHGKRIDPKG